MNISKVKTLKDFFDILNWTQNNNYNSGMYIISLLILRILKLSNFKIDLCANFYLNNVEY